MPLIVVVDDRPTNRVIFSQMARSVQTDIDVQAFGNPVEALDWLADNEADLVITDYKMLQLNGAEFTRRLRALPNGEEVPVVVITAYDDRDFRLEALSAGATDFLQTPVDPIEFQARTRNLLKLRSQQQTIRERARSLELSLKASEESREEVLRDSRERLAQVIDNVPALVSATDRRGACVFSNAHHATFGGPDAARGHHERSRTLDDLVFESGAPLPSFEEEAEDASGNRRIFLTTKSPLFDASRRVINVLTTSLDITGRKEAEQRLRYIAEHDGLTDLANRAFFYANLQTQIARGRRGERSFALHFVDLDRFKAVNDGLGHHIGDKLLREVADRLREVVGQAGLVARLGGDEFAILQTEIARPEDIARLADRIVERLHQPYILDTRRIRTSASIGITLSPKDGRDGEELLKNADLAMYRAKLGGRNGYRFFAEELDNQAKESVLLEVDLRNALERRQFVLHYQPQMDLDTGEVIGTEALLRWNRPGWGLVGPSAFLPVAEESGLILFINEWVLREACRQALEWQRQGVRFARMAVNLSPLQLKAQNVCQSVMEVLDDTGLDPRLLELELTESMFVEITGPIVAGLLELKAAGVRLALDDFGIGYSSLGTLKEFPVDRLKIDQSFIRNLKDSGNDAAILRAVLSLGRALGIEVVAEGVENFEQVTRLRSEGCKLAQGYYFSRPQPADAFEVLLRKGGPMPRSA